MKLKDRVAIVTGGGLGIGRAYVERLAAEGARIVIADIAEDRAMATAEELRAMGHDVVAIRTDVSDEFSVNAMVAQTVELYGRIDILVNNAALFVALLPKKPFWETTVEEWDRTMAVNVRGIFLCCKAVFPHMKAQGKGKIVNISSSTFWHGSKNMVHYVTSKGAVVGLTRALAKDLGEYNINVNAISPGLTESEGVLQNYDSGVLGTYAVRRCLARSERPQDLVGTVAFLASDDSNFITGQTINVDGGDAFH
ncbi:MAG: 3-oxoacyl-ACP reductase FabG [Chloroflexi bacterium]|nr:3-oxoacyl-ACP reductase FabG [Chloroflexota bacterium]